MPTSDPPKKWSVNYMILGVLLLVLIFTSCINFANMNYNHYYFPTGVTLYNVEPIKEIFSASAGVMSRDKDTHSRNYFTAYQHAKYNMGCYGDGTDAIFGADAATNIKTLATTPNVVTHKLMELEYTATKWNQLSACTCIDQMVMSIYSGNKSQAKTAAQAGSTDAATNPWWAGRDVVATSTEERAAIGFTNIYSIFYTAADDASTLPEAKTVEFDATYDADDETKIIEFCMVTGKPQFTTKYEGVINVQTLQLIGQLFLICGIIHELQKHEMPGSKSGDFMQKILYFSGYIVFLLSIVLYFVFMQHHTDENKPEDVAFRSDSHTKYMQGGSINFAVIFIFAFLGFCSLVEIFRKYRSSAKAEATALAKNMRETKYTAYINTQVFLSLGWILLILGVAIQARVQQINVLAVYIIIIVAIACVKSCNEIIKNIYHDVCLNMETALQNDITTTRLQGNQKSTRAVLKANHFLNSIGYVRFGAFIAVSGLSIALLLLANQTVDHNYHQNAKEGRLFYVVLVFIISNIAVDVCMEMVPTKYENLDALNDQTQKMNSLKFYIIVVFLLWLNINYLVSHRHDLHE